MALTFGKPEGTSIPRSSLLNFNCDLSGTRNSIMPEIKSVWITTRQPQGSDPGAVELGYYTIVGGFVSSAPRPESR